MSLFSRLFGHSKATRVGGYLYKSVGEAARVPHFFTEMKVPDTLDGRFDMLMLMQSILTEILMERGQQAVVREMQEQLIRDMDRNLREIGVGDLSVGKQIKAMGSALLGRQAAYHKALKDDGPLLEEAIRRNIYGEDEMAPAADLADIARTLHAAWSGLSLDDMQSALPVKLG